MIDRALVNCWRGEISVSVLKPWIMQLERNGKRYPTLDQIRRKFHNSDTIDDYVQKFAEFYLYDLCTTNYKSTPSDSILVAIDNNRLNRHDREVLTVVDYYKKKGIWPRQRRRIYIFAKDLRLTKLRCHHISGICCEMIQIKDNTQECRKKCMLCFKSIVMRNTY